MDQSEGFFNYFRPYFSTMDPIGKAIYHYYFNQDIEKLSVESNYTEGEEIDPAYFFRRFDEMPEIEKTALRLCRGKVLDVGAGAGCHSLELFNRGFSVVSIEKSELAAEVLKQRGACQVFVGDIYRYTDNQFDTILLLMNGAGIAGTLKGMKKLLKHLKNLLKPDGQILLDSADIRYLFYEEDGSYWIDITNIGYYGEMIYTVTYKNSITSIFPWLYIDFERLKKTASGQGLHTELIARGEDDTYLVRLTKSNIH